MTIRYGNCGAMMGESFDNAYGVALALANALMHYAALVARHDPALASDVLSVVRDHVDTLAAETAFSDRDRLAITGAFDLASAAIDSSGMPRDVPS